MKKLSVVVTAVCLLLTLSSKAQIAFPVPTSYTLKEKADYPRYNQDILNTIDWLQQTPSDQQINLRKQATTFLIAWLTGTPDVSIELNSTAVKLTDKNKELLISFMGGYAKYALLHKADFSKDAANAAAVQAVLTKYQNGPTHVKDNYLDKLIKIQEQGKLNSWITNDFYKSK